MVKTGSWNGASETVYAIAVAARVVRTGHHVFIVGSRSRQEETDAVRSVMQHCAIIVDGRCSEAGSYVVGAAKG